MPKYPFKSFYGTSRYPKLAYLYGLIHAVPPQEGIPGFQRISFLKFFPDNGYFDPESIWAYEGCVLPGNRIIVGRWWWVSSGHVLDDDTLSGPFIYWNIEDKEVHSASYPADDEAMKFLRSLQDHGFSS
jgi:hypothetical protein